jgi:hypothetical protein
LLSVVGLRDAMKSLPRFQLNTFCIGIALSQP